MMCEAIRHIVRWRVLVMITFTHPSVVLIIICEKCNQLCMYHADIMKWKGAWLHKLLFNIQDLFTSVTNCTV